MYNQNYWSMSISDVLTHLETSINGLTNNQAEERLGKYGFNEIKELKFKLPIDIFFAQFKNPLIILLLFMSIIIGFLGAIVNMTIILLIIFINGIIGFIQENKLEKAVKGLKSQLKFMTKVVREGKKSKIEINNIVIGDVINLEYEDIVPADLRLIEINNLSIDESSLRNDYYIAQKTTSMINTKINPSIIDLKNIAFKGTYVKRGNGIGVVIATGKNTYLGKNIDHVIKTKSECDFQKELMEFRFELLIIIILGVSLIALINIFYTNNLINLILFSLILATILIPFNMPTIISLALSRGAINLEKNDVLIKNLLTIEHLGNIDVICTDKTGTITEEEVILEKFSDVYGNEEDKIILYSLLCNSMKNKDDIGNPVDNAIWNFIEEKNFDMRKFNEYEKIMETPFDSNWKRMNVLVKHNNKLELIIKGAPELIVDLSTHVWNQGLIEELKNKEILKNSYVDLGNLGYRVVAVAYKQVPEIRKYSEEEVFGLIFLGYIIFFNPPKDTAKEALENCRKLGIEIKILTGDGPFVSKKVAQDVGLSINDNQIILGKEIDLLSEEDLTQIVVKKVIFARVTPENKLRIIKALNRCGKVTASIGNGLNDVAAMKEADVGITIGKASDVAIDAADLILLENNMNLLVNGIIEGRKTFINTVKFLLYSLSRNFTTISMIAGSSVIIQNLPIQPTQLIIANLLMDAPTLSISTDNVDEDALIRPRRWNILEIFKYSGLIGISHFSSVMALILLLIFYFKTDLNLFRTIIFFEMVISAILSVFIIRTDKIFYKSKIASNKLIGSSILALFISLFLIFHPFHEIFGFLYIPLSIMIIMSLLLIGQVCIVELIKKYYFQKLLKPNVY